MPSFEYHLLDLSGMSDDEIKGALFLRVFLIVLKNIDSPDLLEVLRKKVWPLFEKLFEEDSGLRYFEEVLRYLFKAGPHLHKEEVAEKVKTILNNEAYEVIMTVAEQLEQQGIKKGIEKGIEKGILLGRQEEACQLLKRQLLKKFGEVIEPYQEILVALSVDELEILGERLVTESTLEAIFKGFPSKLS